MGDSKHPELTTIPRASRRLGVGVRQLRRAIDDGQLTLYRIGGWPRLRWSEILAWIESTKRPP